MTIKTVNFNDGVDGAVVNSTANGNFAAVAATGSSWNYSSTAAFEGSLGVRIVPGGSAVMRDGITATKVTLGAWVRFSAAPTADWYVLHTDGGGPATAALFMVNLVGKARVNAKTVIQATEPGTFPLNTWVWVSLYVDAGTSATTGAVRAAYYTQAGGNTPIWDSGLISGIDTAGTTGQLVNVRYGKNSATAMSITFDMDLTTYRTDSDATQTIAPAGNVAPTATYTQATQSVAAGATVSATLSGTDPDGSISAYQHSIDFPGSGGPTLTNASSATVTFTAPAAPALVKLSGYVVDNAQAQSPATTTEIRIPGSAAQLTTIPNVVAASTGTVTNVGGSPAGALLADTSDSTYVEASAGGSFTVRCVPIASPSALNVIFRLSTDTGAGSAKVELLQGTSTVVQASSTLSITATPTDYTLAVTNLSAITDPGALYVRVTSL
jgi:hypothetical protein